MRKTIAGILLAIGAVSVFLAVLNLAPTRYERGIMVLGLLAAWKAAKRAVYGPSNPTEKDSK
jgi:hypothetical protein